MRGLFEFAAGSVRGRDHVLSGKNNQDAYHVLSEDDLTVIVVCDGCGESKLSEVGAILGSQIIAETIARNARTTFRTNQGRSVVGGEFWETVRQDVLAQFRVIARQMGSSMSQVVSNNFLFTTVVALITPSVSVFVAIGDGVIIVNGEEAPIGSYVNNEPPYINYGLVETHIDPKLLRFRIWKTLETETLMSFLLGTDGVGDLIRAAEKNIPGKQELVGPIGQFWENDAYFVNPDAVRRQLTLFNRDGQKIDWEARRVERYHGVLRDDTTLVVGRRKR